MNDHPPDYFEVLPCHPRPRPFESLTSYLTRLAQGNGINKWAGVWLYLGFPPHYSGPRVNILSDYPPASWGLLPQLTNRSEAELLATTFYHLTQKFGRAARPQAMGRFLQSCLSHTLRFCPTCLAEDGFYALPWRLLTLTGCAKHGCRLLERCGHCGQPIPFLTRPLVIGVCPNCGGDLRECQTELLPAPEWAQVIEHDQDLRFLLAPDPTTPVDPQEAIRFVGLRLAYWRLEQGKLASEMRAQFEFPNAARIYGMEGRAKWNANFERYVHYAANLRVGFRQVFNTTLPSEVNEQNWRAWCRTGLSREQSLVEQVQTAISSLQAEQKPLSQAAVARRVGKSEATLLNYPAVKAILQEVVADRKLVQEQQEQALLAAVPSALAQLKEAGILPTRVRVSALVGCHHLTLDKYQRIRAMIATAVIEFYLNRRQQLQQRQQALRQHCSDPGETELAQAVQVAQEQLRAANKRVSQQAISQLVKVPQWRLKEQPQVRLIFEQMAVDRQLARQRGVLERATATQSPECRVNPHREAELFEAVQMAIKQLEAAGKPITQRLIAECVGLGPSALRRYPRIKVIFDRLSQEYPQRRQAERQQYEQELVAQVQAAIARLEALNQPLLQRDVAQLVGIQANTLRHYPQVKALLSQLAARRRQILIEQRERRDVDLANKVQQAAETLSRDGHSVTKEAIGQLVGLCPSGLKKYRQAEAILAQVTR